METIKGRRLTNRESTNLEARDYDIPSIPPLRIKLKPTGIVGKDWLQGAHGDIEGDSVMVIGMRPGGDIVQGLVGDDSQEDKEEDNET